MNLSSWLNLALAIALVVLVIMLVRTKRGADSNENAIESADSNESAGLHKIAVEELTDNAVKLFHEDWCLVTAGEGDKHNAMTIGWGEIGVLWRLPVVTVYIRPDRYTNEFMNSSKYFTVSAFSPEYRELLNYLGNVSGRDEDKIAKSELKTSKTDNGSLLNDDARLVIECEKIYAEDLSPENFTDEQLYLDTYQRGDSTLPTHRMYVGKIVNVWVR